MITVRRVESDDADARVLWKAQERDLAERYDDPDLELETDFPTLVGSWVGYEQDGTPVASIVARWSPYSETAPGDMELKRLWVAPGNRGNGHARVMLGVAERAARKAGATRLILETGTEQPEAMALYESTGWTVMEPYGEYRDEPDSRCYAKPLPTRVLVLNGTLGAGKTTIAAAAHDLLGERKSRTGYIDADFLCQAHPAPASDVFNQSLMFANLQAVAGNYRARGYGLMVIARVVEDPDERVRWEQVFSSADAGAAEVTFVRVVAPEEVRLARIAVREPEGHWRDWSSARSVELDAILEELDLDDAVVDNAGDRDRLDVAALVLERVNW